MNCALRESEPLGWQKALTEGWYKALGAKLNLRLNFPPYTVAGGDDQRKEKADKNISRKETQ